jgi:hypothetical protein
MGVHCFSPVPLFGHKTFGGEPRGGHDGADPLQAQLGIGFGCGSKLSR